MTLPFEADYALYDQRQRLMRFYATVAEPGGGFMWLDASGARSLVSFGYPLWHTARMVHCFSLLSLLGADGASEMVAHGLGFLRQRHLDALHGGYYWNAAVRSPSHAKRAYGHVFVLLAASSAITAGFQAADVYLEALQVLDEHMWDAVGPAYVEDHARDWLARSAPRTQNCNMHAVEALLAAHGLQGDPALLNRACEISRFFAMIAERHDWRVVEYFSDNWQPILLDREARGTVEPLVPGWIPGHGFEWAKLLCQLAFVAPAAAGDLIDWARRYFDRALQDGLRDGQLLFSCHWDGTPRDVERVHWPATEALGASWYLWTTTHEERYLRRYQEFRQYLLDQFVDPAGGWFYRKSRRGIADGKPDLYHALQATLYSALPLSSSVAASILRVRGPSRP
jgi:mannose/cellobiose epimerase-like protein (N-acyl-D-glucosamine 2-epimerase family)